MIKDRTMTFVIALGGNCILRAGQRGTIEEQYENLRRTAEQLLGLLSGREPHRNHSRERATGRQLAPGQHDGAGYGAAHAAGHLWSRHRRLHGLHDSEHAGQLP